jgi:predicted DNA-binding transcriptional regulator YafY
LSRAQRLLDLIQAFRRHRRPVSGAALAEELGISLRTLYRDVETLKADPISRASPASAMCFAPASCCRR